MDRGSALRRDARGPSDVRRCGVDTRPDGCVCDVSSCATRRERRSRRGVEGGLACGRARRPASGEAPRRNDGHLFLAFADIEVKVHDAVVDEEQQRAVLIFTIHATQQGEFLGFPASRRRTATPSAYAFTLKNGRIVSERRLYDYAGFLLQLGILKTRNV